MSPQYQQLHLHPYPPAQHRSRASAHPDPYPLLLSFCFYGRQEYQSTQTRSGPFSTTSLRPGAIQAPNFELHAACRHDRFLHHDWASWPNPGPPLAFGCPQRARHPSFVPFPSKSCQACSSVVSNFTIFGLFAQGQSHRPKEVKRNPSCQACSSVVSNFMIIGLVAKGQSHRPFFFSHNAAVDSGMLKLVFCST